MLRITSGSRPHRDDTVVMSTPNEDMTRARIHADTAENFLAEAAGVSDELMQAFATRAAAHAALATYYELRAQR
jgi:acetyl-CoA acetyltransferase